MDDRELLRRYVRDGCAESFGVVMRRHIGWVYSASLRQVGDAALGEDVTQSVFVLLTRRAGELGDKVVLRGWLFNTLRFVAREARRNQGRRRRHEARVAVDTGGAGAGGERERIEGRAGGKMAPLVGEAAGAGRGWGLLAGGGWGSAGW